MIAPIDCVKKWNVAEQTMSELYKLARPLLDGVPIRIENQEAVDIESRMVNDMLRGLPQFVGELVVGNPIDPNCRERSLALTEDLNAVEVFVFWVYDIRTTHPYPLKDRLKIAEPMVVGACPPWVQWVDHELVTDQKELQAYIDKVVKDNFFKGIVLREPFGTYGTQDEEIPAEALGVMAS